jgi:sporulation protein YlmC with PRC-barrel domain
MLKPATSCLVAAALAAAPALAQTGDRPTATGAGSTTAGSPSMRPGTASDQTATSPASPTTSTMGSTSGTGAQPMTPSSTGTTTGAPSGGTSTVTTGSSSGSMPSGTSMSTSMGGSFIARQEMGQLLASKLIGTTVVSQNNETIGDVNDVLFDRGGQVMAAVIGVGGFLGIGEKDVAVPFQQLEFVANTDAPSAANTAPPTTPAPPASTTGSTTTTTTAPRDPMPSRVMLKMTKADLQGAPTFEEYGRASGTSAPAGGATTTTTTPLRQ